MEIVNPGDRKEVGPEERIKQEFNLAVKEAESLAHHGGNIGGENIDTTMFQDALAKLDARYAELRKSLEERALKSRQEEIPLH